MPSASLSIATIRPGAQRELVARASASAARCPASRTRADRRPAPRRPCGTPRARCRRRATFSIRARPSASSFATPPSTSISAPSTCVSSRVSTGPAAAQHLDRLADLERVADRAAERRVHVGEHARHALAGARARSSASARTARARCSIVFMNAPRPTLQSSTSPSMPSASFFDMIDDAISGSDSTVAGDVAQRVEPLVGGRDPRGLADQAHAELVDELARTRSTGRSTRKPGIASSLSSVPPVWPRPRPDTIGTATPHAATAARAGSRSCRRRRRSSACRPSRRAIARQIDHVARARHRVGHVASSRVVEAAEEDRHQHRGDLVVGDACRR